MFRVTTKYARDTNERELKNFKTINEAKEFIGDELRKAVAMKINVAFRVYEGYDLIEEFDATKLNTLPSKEESDQSGKGQGQSASFKPSPLSTKPTPAGMPKSWQQSDDKDKDKK